MASVQTLICDICSKSPAKRIAYVGDDGISVRDFCFEHLGVALLRALDYVPIDKKKEVIIGVPPNPRLTFFRCGCCVEVDKDVDKCPSHGDPVKTSLQS